MIFNNLALPSSSGEAKIASITAAERSRVIRVGCARNRKPDASDVSDEVNLLHQTHLNTAESFHEGSHRCTYRIALTGCHICVP